MASILEFRVPPDSKPGSAAIRNCDSSKIIIFPGVRYERWSEAPQPKQKKQSKPKRLKSQTAE